MKIPLIFLVFFLFAATMQCQKATFQKSPISGTYVETVNKTDTLDFLPEYDGLLPIFWLKRGVDKNKLPKHYSGPYHYEIFDNTISINWFLSSNSGFHGYYFKLSPNKKEMQIVNFFDNPYMNQDTLTFERIE